MSTIGVTYHNEDIHNIIHEPLPTQEKSPKYKRKNKFTSGLEFKEKNKYNGHQTFGLAHYKAPESYNFLKKGKHKTHSPVKLIDKEEFKCTKINKSTPVPKCCLQMSPQSKKNFVKENIKKMSALEPKVPCPRRVVTPRGTVKDMAHLIQMIKVRQSEAYGNIPKYLCDRRKKWIRANEKRELEEALIKEYKEKMGIGVWGMSENVYMLDGQTREKLLEGLKENWNELSKQFLKLPLIIDTWPKIKKKMWLEKEMEQLEKDVKLVENHPYIYLEKHDARAYSSIILAELRQKTQMEKEKKRQQELECEKNECENKGNEAAKEEEKGECEMKVEDKEECQKKAEESENKTEGEYPSEPTEEKKEADKTSDCQPYF